MVRQKMTEQVAFHIPVGVWDNPNDGTCSLTLVKRRGKNRNTPNFACRDSAVDWIWMTFGYGWATKVVLTSGRRQ